MIEFLVAVLVVFGLGFWAGWIAHARTLYRRLKHAIERGENV